VEYYVWLLDVGGSPIIGFGKLYFDTVALRGRN
jgi:hypothetical protein